MGEKVRRRRPADRRRRHQEPGRRDHRPSLAGAAVRRPWRGSRPDLPAQHRRQHRLPQHAGAQAAQVEEAFQDGIRPVAARRAARRRGYPHRPLRLHSLAARQQDRLHPPGGARLRRCAAGDRTQAVGAGFLEQRRRRHRRSALREARIGPRGRRAARSAVGLFHEEPRRASSATASRYDACNAFIDGEPFDLPAEAPKSAKVAGRGRS